MQHRASELSTDRLCLQAETVPVSDANGLNNRSLTLSHLEVRTELLTNRPEIIPTLGDRYVPTLFWLSGEPVGYIESTR